MKVLVYSPPYNENSGGIVCLHRLCHLLNEIGIDCQVIIYTDKVLGGARRLFIKRLIDKIRSWTLPSKRWINQDWNYCFVKNRLLGLDKFDIVIYPEIVAGNPLAAANVVRWLLYHPGRITGVIDYGKNDFLIRFGDSWDISSVSEFFLCDKLLRVVYFPFEKYVNNHEIKDRKGVAYLWRKGAGRKVVHPADAICIDGLSHDEVAVIFKSVKTFISYDLQTAYLYFAAIAGADSVVIPEDGVDIDKWIPDARNRYGIAYGFENLEWARNTRGLLKEYMRDMQDDSLRSVSDFISEVSEYFSIPRNSNN